MAEWYNRYWLHLIAVIVLASAVWYASAEKPHQARPMRVLVVGDSIAMGSRQFSTPWWCYLPRDVELVNIARSGADSGDIFAPNPIEGGAHKHVLNPWQPLPNAAFDVLIIHVGTNDCRFRVPVSGFKSNLRRIAESGISRHVVICTPSHAWNRDGTPLEGLAEYRRAASDVAKAAEFPCIDMSRVIPDERAYYADHVHLNGRGARLMGKAIRRALESLR